MRDLLLVHLRLLSDRRLRHHTELVLQELLLFGLNALLHM